MNMRPYRTGAVQRLPIFKLKLTPPKSGKPLAARFLPAQIFDLKPATQQCFPSALNPNWKIFLGCANSQWLLPIAVQSKTPRKSSSYWTPD